MYVLVIFRDGKGLEVDLKLSSKFIVSELVKSLKDLYNLEDRKENKLQVEPLGKILSSEKTLEEHDICNGYILTLV